MPFRPENGQTKEHFMRTAYIFRACWAKRVTKRWKTHNQTRLVAFVMVWLLDGKSCVGHFWYKFSPHVTIYSISSYISIRNIFFSFYRFKSIFTARLHDLCAFHIHIKRSSLFFKRLFSLSLNFHLILNWIKL